MMRSALTIGSRRAASLGAEWQYCHISRDVLPALREAGVSGAEIDTMLVDNPRRIFETVGGY